MATLPATCATAISKNLMDVPVVAAVSSRLQRAAARLYSSRFWGLMGRTYRELVRTFTVHPAETHETYLQHLWFTIRMSVRFAAIGVLLLTHGIFPFLFTRTASSQIEKLYIIMRSRIPQARRKAIESEYEI